MSEPTDFAAQLARVRSWIDSTVNNPFPERLAASLTVADRDSLRAVLVEYDRLNLDALGNTVDRMPSDSTLIKTSLLDSIKAERDALARFKQWVHARLNWVFARMPAPRCYVTGNLCGTDTWEVNHPCKCASCQARLKLTEGGTNG